MQIIYGGGNRYGISFILWTIVVLQNRSCSFNYVLFVLRLTKIDRVVIMKYEQLVFEWISKWISSIFEKNISFRNGDSTMVAASFLCLLLRV